MKLTAQIDRRELEKSIRKFSKQYGETSAQAVIRWSVQVCRGLALQTQAYGRSGTRKIQINAIQRDMVNIMYPVKKWTVTKNGMLAVTTIQGRRLTIRPENTLATPADIDAWIRQNRNNRGRTHKLPDGRKKACLEKDWKQVLKARSEHAGMAKGGWVGAGQSIAMAQSGQYKISIGKNYLAYTQKFTKYGRARRPRAMFSPSARLTNTVRHSSAKNVLSRGATKTAIDEGLRATVKWYRTAVRKMK